MTSSFSGAMARQKVLKNREIFKALRRRESIDGLYDFLSGHTSEKINDENAQFVIEEGGKVYTFKVLVATLTTERF